MAPRLTARDHYLRSITESQWQTTVEGLLAAGGWVYYHAPDNRPVTAASGRKYVQDVKKGWPDLVAFRGDRRVALELKREVGAIKPGQIDWLRVLRHHGFEVGIYRPSHESLLQASLLRGAALPGFPENL